MENQVVPFDTEPPRRQIFHVSRAGVDREHAVAAVAAEMVMVVVRVPLAQFAQCLVASGLIGQIYPHHVVVIEQSLELPVDRRQVEMRDGALGQLANLQRSQRSPAVGQGSQYGIALACLASHGGTLMQMQMYLQQWGQKSLHLILPL
jgi:hypothetical protein